LFKYLSKLRLIKNLSLNPEISNVLRHYFISREEITGSDSELSRLKAEFDKLEITEKYSIIESVELK